MSMDYDTKKYPKGFYLVCIDYTAICGTYHASYRQHKRDLECNCASNILHKLSGKKRILKIGPKMTELEAKLYILHRI